MRLGPFELSILGEPGGQPLPEVAAEAPGGASCAVAVPGQAFTVAFTAHAGAFSSLPPDHLLKASVLSGQELGGGGAPGGGHHAVVPG